MKGPDYAEYLESKKITTLSVGFNAIDINAMLFPFQKDIVKWALKKGRAAIFADCGLGKTPMQLEWANQVHKYTGGNVLILAPLAVSNQTAREGKKFGIEVNVCRNQSQVKPGINIANYEMLQHFDANFFTGIVLDESSILKSYSGKIRTEIIEKFAKTPYKLACTATPAPNDFMELGNHTEFLGIMSRGEMLSMFFVHDGGETSKWRLKGHAESKYWEWVASWAVVIRKPSDLGYDDGPFTLPELKLNQHTVLVDEPIEGHLFAIEAQTLQERQAARRTSIDDRVQKCAELVNNSSEQWVVWCGLNNESSALTKAINGAIEVKGSDSQEHKEKSIIVFINGDLRVMVSKVSIFGFGMNMQQCSNMAFVGLSDSYEAFYQAVRRCWRFGQDKPVNVHIITAETEGAVVANIKRKELDSLRMIEEMVKHTQKITQRNIKQSKKEITEYHPEQEMVIPEWMTA